MKKSRRVAILLVSFLLAMVSLVGCKKDTDVIINVDQLAQQLAQEAVFKDELVELDDSMFDVNYYEVSEDDIVSKKVYYNSGATVEQVVVIEAKDHTSAQDIKGELQKCIDEQIDQNKNYLPDEVPKLEKPVLKTMSNYVILVVSEDNSKVETILDQIK